MRKVLSILISLSLIVGLGVVSAIPALAHTESDPYTVELMAGQHIDVGEVAVWNDADNLYIKFILDAGWDITESHLYVGKNAPTWSTPGQFPYSPDMNKSPSANAEYNAAEMMYTIPLAEIYEFNFVGKGKGKGLNPTDPGVTCEDIIYFAAHAVVETTEGEYMSETAWGGCIEFGTNWALYCTYQIQCEPPEWPETVTIAFEDLEIMETSDYDYNDWVADIDTVFTWDGFSLSEINFTITPEARGAGLDHIFHLLILADIFPGDGTYTLTLYDGIGGTISTDTGTFDASVDNDFVVIPWTREALPGRLTNTIEPDGITSHFAAFPADHEPYVPPERTAELNIVFDSPVVFDLSTYDPYDPANVHGDGLFFDPYLEIDLYAYEIHQGDVRMIAVPTDWLWPEAGVAISDAYPAVTAGNPPTFATDWWDSYVDDTTISVDDDLIYNGKP